MNFLKSSPAGGCHLSFLPSVCRRPALIDWFQLALKKIILKPQSNKKVQLESNYCSMKNLDNKKNCQNIKFVSCVLRFASAFR